MSVETTVKSVINSNLGDLSNVDTTINPKGKGSLIAYNTTSGNWEDVAVGLDDQVLKADSTNAQGVSWKNDSNLDINSRPSGTVAGGDEILFGDIDDSNIVKKTTASSILGLQKLNDHSDVAITSASIHDTLSYNGTNWINNNTLTVDTTSKYVGVNEDPPTAPLSIYDTAGTGYLKIDPKGSATEGLISINGTKGWKIQQDTANTKQLWKIQAGTGLSGDVDIETINGNGETFSITNFAGLTPNVRLDMESGTLQQLDIASASVPLWRVYKSGLVQSQITNYETLVVNDDDFITKKYFDDNLTAGAFNDLTDVNITSVSAGDTVKYNATAVEYQNFKGTDGTIKLNSGAGGAATKPTFTLVANVEQQITYTTTLNVSGFPTTSVPQVDGTYADSLIYNFVTDKFQESSTSGGINWWRITFDWSGKSINDVAGVSIRIHNPLSGFNTKGVLSLPEGITSDTGYTTILATIADSASLGFGYEFFVKSTKNINLTVDNIVRLNTPYNSRL